LFFGFELVYGMLDFRCVGCQAFFECRRDLFRFFTGLCIVFLVPLREFRVPAAMGKLLQSLGLRRTAPRVRIKRVF
jgi:hypothetical protein